MPVKRYTLAILALLSFAGTAVALNVDSTDKYAWGENIGWLNWSTTEGDIDIDDGVDMDGYIWGENVGWISLTCANTSSCGTVDYGVDASGSEWTGYAWGENVGWVSFSCDNTSSCGTVEYAVRSSGSEELIGYAWGENIGWINLNCDNNGSCGTVEFGVRYVSATPTPTPTPTGGGGGGGFIVTPTPTPTASPWYVITPTPTATPGTPPTGTPPIAPPGTPTPTPPVFPTPTSAPPGVTPPAGPPVVAPPVLGIVDRIADAMDRFSSVVFGRLCEGPLGLVACGTTAMSSIVVLIAFGAALLQSEVVAAVLSLLQIVGVRKRTKVWGVVYDSHTKQPIPLVKLELMDAANRVLETRYADRDGRYGFLTSPASLHEEELKVHIRASKPGFTFPSSITTAGTDYIVYENLYRGGTIILRGNSILNHNIPMDPTVRGRISWSGFGQGLVGAVGDKLLSLGFFIGLVAVPLNWWFAPSTKNLVIGIVFVLANAIRMLALYRPYGVTRDALTGKRMSYALVILNDLNGNRQGFAVSDEHGRFILSGEADKDYEIIAYTPANITPQRSITRRVRGLKRLSTRAWITENLTI